MLNVKNDDFSNFSHLGWGLWSLTVISFFPVGALLPVTWLFWNFINEFFNGKYFIFVDFYTWNSRSSVWPVLTLSIYKHSWYPAATDNVICNIKWFLFFFTQVFTIKYGNGFIAIRWTKFCKNYLNAKELLFWNPTLFV